jgi:hypothetical protein
MSLIPVHRYIPAGRRRTSCRGALSSYCPDSSRGVPLMFEVPLYILSSLKLAIREWAGKYDD